MREREVCATAVASRAERTTGRGEETVLLHPLSGLASPIPGRRYLSSLSTARREYSWAAALARACRRSHPAGRHETSRRTEIRRRTFRRAAVKDGHEGTKSLSSLGVRGWAREG